MIIPEHTQAVGLCSTCNNSPTCFFRAGRGPALFCEMFDDYVAAPPEETGGRMRPAADPSPAFGAVKDDLSRYAGLCMNCENRGSCAHPKPAGGIWHCEDYE